MLPLRGPHSMSGSPQTGIQEQSRICFFAAKKQRHDMVHVEIWVGDGEKTLGARWQKGV